MISMQKLDMDSMSKESERLYKEKYSQSSYRRNLLTIYKDVENKKGS